MVEVGLVFYREGRGCLNFQYLMVFRINAGRCRVCRCVLFGSFEVLLCYILVVKM